MAGATTEVVQPGATTPGKQGVDVTPRAVARIRSAMLKEGISPTEGGLRLGILGGGCSGLSYTIRFGLGRFNSEAEVDYVADKVIDIVKKLRELSPLYEMVKEGIDISKIEWQAH